MERIKALNRYQRGILLVLVAMVLVFAVLYALTLGRVGFAYRNAILVPEAGQGTTVYSGTIKGEQARFTVTDDRTVTFQFGGKTYGPYTAREDATAIPRDNGLADSMVGLELRCGERILFRGGVLDPEGSRMLYHADGSWTGGGVTITSGSLTYDASGNLIDPMEPSAEVILDLMAGPRLTHKGVWWGWFCGTVLCILIAVSVLFADELFRWNLSFRIRNADRAEPSHLALADRYIGWTIATVMLLFLFWAGLR